MSRTTNLLFSWELNQNKKGYLTHSPIIGSKTFGEEFSTCARFAPKPSYNIGKIYYSACFLNGGERNKSKENTLKKLENLNHPWKKRKIQVVHLFPLYSEPMNLRMYFLLGPNPILLIKCLSELQCLHMI